MTRNKLLIAVGVLVAVFAAGFLPQYMRSRDFEEQLTHRTRELEQAQLLNLVGEAYVHAAQKNFGLASQTSTQFFNRMREVADAHPDRAAGFQEILARRDKVTAALAKADPAALGDLEDIYLKTRALTAQ